MMLSCPPSPSEVDVALTRQSLGPFTRNIFFVVFSSKKALKVSVENESADDGTGLESLSRSTLKYCVSAPVILDLNLKHVGKTPTVNQDCTTYFTKRYKMLDINDDCIKKWNYSTIKGKQYVKMNYKCLQ